MAKNDQQRASVSTPINNFLYFFAYFICGVELPALWMNCHWGNVYDLRESHNCPRTFHTYFIKVNKLQFAAWIFAVSNSFSRLINKGITQTSVGMTEEAMIYPSITMCVQYSSRHEQVAPLEEAYHNRMPLEKIVLSVKHQYEKDNM